MRVLLCDFHSLIDTNHLCGRRRFSLKSLRETFYSPLLLVHLGSLWGSQVLEVFLGDRVPCFTALRARVFTECLHTYALDVFWKVL